MYLLNYQTIGEGPDLILLHGFAMSSIFLKPFAEKLSLSYQVHLFDLPGFGESFHIPLPDKPAILAEYLLKHLPEHAIWVGWSLGGLIASWIALNHPKRVVKLMNIASSPCFLADQDWPGIAVKDFSEFSENLKKDYVKTLMRFLSLQMGEPAKQMRTLVKQQTRPSDQTLDAGIKLMLETDLRQTIQMLSMPCLYLLGEKDRLVPAEIHKKITAQGIQTVLLPESAHLPFISQEKICLSIVGSF